MGADRAVKRNLFGLGNAIAIRFGAIAFLTGPRFHLVEIRVAEMLEEARGSCLGDTGHPSDLCRGTGEDIILPMEDELGELLLAGGQPRMAFWALATAEALRRLGERLDTQLVAATDNNPQVTFSQIDRALWRRMSAAHIVDCDQPARTGAT